MIIGQFRSKLTDKDRISIPKKFRDEMGPELIVAKWYENCLVLVSKEIWTHFKKRLGIDSKLVIEGIRDIDRFILGSAFEIDFDKQGRFVLPDALMIYAEIKDEVVFLGLEDRVEIWSVLKWEVKEEEAEEKAKIALEKIAEK